jgi:hypothetical protein
LNFKAGRLSALYKLEGNKGRPTAKTKATMKGSIRFPRGLDVVSRGEKETIS